MFIDILQQSPIRLKQTWEETSPSANVGWPLFSQPEEAAPHFHRGTHQVGIFVPASPTKRYHFPNIMDEESSSHFLHRRVCCKYSFCQHRSGFCNYSTDRLKSWIWVNSMFYIFSFIRKIKEKITLFITPILKSLMVPVIWLALTDVIYSRIALFFALNQIFFSSQWGSNVKSKTTNQISRLKMLHSLQKNERQRVANCGKFCSFCFQNSYFFPSKNGWP